MSIQPKDFAILDAGTSDEMPVVVYMIGETIAAVVSATDGADKFRVNMDRLTKIEPKEFKIL